MRRERRDLVVSLAILAFVITFAITGLAFDGNSAKIVRVGASSVTYITVLLGFLLVDRESRPRFAWFLAAGSVTGLVSGVVRPEINIATVIVQALAGGLLIAGVHWLALAHWRRLREQILSITR